MTARRKKKDKRWAFIKFCLITYIVAALFSLIWLRNEVVSFEKEIGQLESKKTKIVRVLVQAAANRAKLYSVENVEKVAMGLGMSAPQRERIFTVKRTTGAIPFKASLDSISQLMRAEQAVDSPNQKMIKEAH